MLGDSRGPLGTLTEIRGREAPLNGSTHDPAKTPSFQVLAKDAIIASL